MATQKSASPFDVTEKTVEDLESTLQSGDYTEVELRALRNDEQNRTDGEDTRSTALDAIDETLETVEPTETDPGSNPGAGDGDEAPAPEPENEIPTLTDDPDTDAVTKAMDDSEYVIGQRVEVKSTSGPYVAGLWFDDSLGTQVATYNRRLAEAVEDGDAKIVGPVE